jgi:UDP-glucose 4-epimerase
MIPLFDLQAQYRTVAPELDAAVLDVLRSGNYVQGKRVAQFEANFASFCGGRESVAVNSGTSALHLALLALGVGQGDEVITVPMTFVATTAAIRYVNAKPVFVDIDPVNWTMDPNLLEQAITPRTKAIVPVHLHGRMSDMVSILRVARRHGIPVIEDAAQSHGAQIELGNAGTFGDIGCFSFYAGKNLGACGEGGAIVTNRSDLAATMRCLRDWGQSGKYNHVMHGFNYRMDEIQGAVLDVKLPYLAEWTHKRRAIATLYDRLLEASGVTSPARPVAGEHVYHVYAIRHSQRELIRSSLAASGVATGIHYPRPVHLQPAYAELGYRPGDFPVSEALASEMLSLPIYPEMTEEMVMIVSDAVAAALGQLPSHNAANHPASNGVASASPAPTETSVREIRTAKPIGQAAGRPLARPTAEHRQTAHENPLAGKRVLVTGGAGFIGSHIVDLLVEARCSEVIVLDNMVRGRADNLAQACSTGNVRLVVGDVRDRELQKELVQGVDTVFHQAALRITHCAVEPRMAIEVMVDSTFDLLEDCVAAGVRKVVMASSASVYGMADEFPTSESQHPYNNRTLYGAAKTFAEGLLRSFNDMYGMNYVALRYFNAYGPRMDIHGRYTEVLIRWIERLAAGEPPIIFGDGSQTMDLVHVRDIARANIMAAVSDASDVALNIGTGEETSLLELASLLALVMGRPNLQPVFSPERSINPVPRRTADIRAARATIGFEAEISVGEGLAEVVDWWQRQSAPQLVRESVA